MDVPVICRPRSAEEPMSVRWAELVPREADALRRLREDGLLRRAWSPGTPGAVLLLTGMSRESATGSISYRLPPRASSTSR